MGSRILDDRVKRYRFLISTTKTQHSQAVDFIYDEGVIRLVERVNAMEAAPEAEIREPVVLLTINQRYRDNMTAEEIYAATRGNWVMGERREKAQYAMAVYQGVVQAVYVIVRWHPVESLDKQIKDRWAFDGRESKALKHYIGCSVRHYIGTGAQNPVHYVNC